MLSVAAISSYGADGELSACGVETTLRLLVAEGVLGYAEIGGTSMTGSWGFPRGEITCANLSR